MALTQEISNAIQNGETVHLGDLGYFHITLPGKGAKDTKSVTSTDIKEARLRFVAGNEIENSLRSANLRRFRFLVVRLKQLGRAVLAFGRARNF